MENSTTTPTNTKSPVVLVISLSFLVIALLCINTFLFLQNQKLSKQISQIQAVPTPEITPTPTVNEVTSWKTYTDLKNGITFQYPSEAKTTTREPDPFPVVVQVDNLHPRTGGGGGPEFEGWMIYVSELQPNPKNIPLRQWAKEHELFLDPVMAKEVGSTETPPVDTNINKLSAIKWTMSGGDGSLDYYLVKRSSGITLITVHDNYGEDTKTTNQILSTFRFVDNQVSEKKSPFVCPTSQYIDCMPTFDTKVGNVKKADCSAEAMAWYKSNCPNFIGGAM